LGGVSLWGRQGIEPIKMQQSGGLLLAAGLDGGETIILHSPGMKNASRFPYPAPKKK